MISLQQSLSLVTAGAAITVLLLAGLSACGSADPASPDAQAIPEHCRGDVAASDAFACAAESVCAVYAPCFGGALSHAACQELDLGLFGLDIHAQPLIESALAAGTLTYDSQELSRCLATIRGLRCEDIFAAARSPFAECQPFVGAVTADAECVMDLECAESDEFCERSACGDGDMCCPGRCAATRTSGDSCERHGQCGAGSYCVDGRCADGGVGARCTSDGECDAENHCAAEVCVADRASGAACERDGQCSAPESCVGRNLPAGGTCARSLATGDACSINCRSFASHYCDQPDPGSLGTCRERVGEGTACTSQVMPCQIHMTCDGENRSCRPTGDIDDSCQNSIQCQFFRELYCSTEIDPDAPGRCQGRQFDGAACTDDDHCSSGLCDAGICATVAGCY